MNLNNLKLGFDKVYVISLPKRLDRRERKRISKTAERVALERASRG